MDLEKAWEELITLMKEHFQKEANITVTTILNGGNEKSILLIEDVDEYAVKFPNGWKEENIKEGVDIEQLAANLKFGYARTIKSYGFDTICF